MVAWLAQGRRAVMTRGAIARDPRVVKPRSNPETYCARMAHLARRNCRDMAGRFSDSLCTVVASCAGSAGWNIRMVNAPDIGPCCREMARLTFLIRRHMVLRLADHRLAIVTVKT